MLRGIAAALVVARHVAVHTASTGGTVFDLGQFGVDIFFVLSGVVIYLTGRDLSWHVFLRKRIARIVPLYWIVTLLAIAASAQGRHGPYWLSNAAASLLFVPAHDTAASIWPPVMTGWTLNYEMYFYAVCTVVLLAGLRRRFLVAVAGVIAVGIAIGLPLVWAAGTAVRPAALILLMPISAEFIAGMVLAALWERGLRSPVWLTIALLAAALALLAFTPDMRTYQVDRALLWGPSAAMIVWATMTSEERLPFRNWKWPLLLGDASYAIYIVHAAVLTIAFVAVHHSPIAVPVMVVASGTFALSILTGLFVHLTIEKRLTIFASHVLGLRKAPKAVAMETARQGAMR